jgi:hypothetical protein
VSSNPQDTQHQTPLEVEASTVMYEQIVSSNRFYSIHHEIRPKPLIIRESVKVIGDAIACSVTRTK